ncbi:MAG: Hsp20/alpha crystallin family protein [bacterium]|nr:Hsp20/alpha crystallin family protein [bacterium]
MNLVRHKPWKPFGDFISMQNYINRMFSDAHYGNTKSEAQQDTENDSWSPATDILETENGYVFRLEVPGINKEDISIEFNDNTLLVKGERKADEEIDQESYHRIESYSGTFSRSFSLPKTIDSTKINATMKDGILELEVAKAEEMKPREIPINFN